MSALRLLLLCLTKLLLAKELPDVKCLVVHLLYVQCHWNELETPSGNYTFYGWFHHDKQISECPRYLRENGTNVGCSQPLAEPRQKFEDFNTKLEYRGRKRAEEHNLSDKVKLYPPVNVTIQLGSDSNLWVYWNQTARNCVESEVSYTINNMEGETTMVSPGRQNHCINLPCSHCRYEVQVRSKMERNCGESKFWSDWSEPAVWGSNNSTASDQINSMFVWTSVLTVVGTFTLILLVVMLLHHERLRIIFIPVVPKPFIHRDTLDWFENSKSLKDNFKPNYNEQACTVREYTQVCQSDSESLDSFTSSVTTDQTGCSVFIPTVESGPAPLPAPQLKIT
ncbi:cytokine receptor common subunit gamma-like isoform X2 [Xyrichtys novacula]|uniref:Cytokine receptor common subunit gamma-like isoform X2 n=1 Tax=Xyrichtys novacula TaxID=13765 RepID=A0AAV1FRF8_XYRNO|nr:cytokine receptor common subunit gamma-like isoform X2 [Xyrichtys novacula]